MESARRRYWIVNLCVVGILLAVWAFVSLGCSILFVHGLNKVRLAGSGFKLGFWFAQQGSIYVFVLLIFVYMQVMNRLDKKYGVDEE